MIIINLNENPWLTSSEHLTYSRCVSSAQFIRVGRSSHHIQRNLLTTRYPQLAGCSHGLFHSTHSAPSTSFTEALRRSSQALPTFILPCSWWLSLFSLLEMSAPNRENIVLLFPGIKWINQIAFLFPFCASSVIFIFNSNNCNLQNMQVAENKTNWWGQIVISFPS